MGNREDASEMLNGLRGANPHELAMAYTALGDYDEAFRLLFGIIDEPSFDVYAKTDPAFDRLHADPRWPEVLRRMHYPPRQRAIRLRHGRPIIARPFTAAAIVAGAMAYSTSGLGALRAAAAAPHASQKQWHAFRDKRARN